MFSVPIMAISAVAPPGGCKVFVNCMAIMDVDTAKGAASQIISGINLAIVTPIIAEIICPPITFLGCANGLCMAPNTKTLDAPNEPIRNMFSVSNKYFDWINAISPMPVKAPINDQNFSR